MTRVKALADPAGPLTDGVQRRVTTDGVRRLLLAGSVLYVVGVLIRLAWRSGHPAFGANGYGELWVHAALWLGAATVAVSAGWAVAAKVPGRGYRNVLGAATANLSAEAWHTWAHFHHQEYGAAHVALTLAAAWGVAAVTIAVTPWRASDLLRQTAGMAKGGILQRALEKFLFNPPMRAALRAGVGPSAFALLETTGRRSGRPRLTPVGNGLDGSNFWIVSEHGLRCDYVRNLVANPRVRVKVGRAWRSGTASIAGEDDALARRRTIDHGNGLIGRADGVIFRASASTPVTVRIALD